MKNFFFFGAIRGKTPDEHRHITRGDNLHVEGGSKEEHDEVVEILMKTTEKIKGKDLKPNEVIEVMHEIAGK
jgi:hypothetical protein